MLEFPSLALALLFSTYTPLPAKCLCISCAIDLQRHLLYLSTGTHSGCLTSALGTGNRGLKRATPSDYRKEHSERVASIWPGRRPIQRGLHDSERPSWHDVSGPAREGHSHLSVGLGGPNFPCRSQLKPGSSSAIIPALPGPHLAHRPRARTGRLTSRRGRHCTRLDDAQISPTPPSRAS